MTDTVSTAGTAVLSSCGTYRYHLTRRVSSGLGTCVFIMLNPSTADAAFDDPTIRRCLWFTKREGHRKLVVVNLFALRATNPKALKEHAEPCGPENDYYIRKAVNDSFTRRIILAWGNHGRLNHRGCRVEELVHLCDRGVPIQMFGRTKLGEPIHPLYQANDAPLRHVSEVGYRA